MALPGNMSLVWVRGTFLNLDGSAMTGRITFSANVIGGALVNPTAKRIIGASPFSGTLDANTGYFQVQLPATNDPDVTPVGFTYSVVEPTGRKYSITVPFDAPALDSPGDPLHGQQVIELSDIVPAPGASGGTAQLLRGRGIKSMDVDDAGHLVVTYDDDATEDLGLVPTGGVDRLVDLTDVDTTGAAAGQVVTPTQVSGGVPTEFGLIDAAAALPAALTTIAKAPNLTAGQRVITTFADGHGFTVTQGGTASDNLNDTADAILGAQSMKLVTDGAGTFKRADRVGGLTIDLADRLPVLWVKVDDTTHLLAIELWFGSAGFGIAYRFSPWNSTNPDGRIETIQSGQWLRLTIPWSTQTLIGTFGSPNRGNLNSVRIAVADDGAAPVTVHIGGVGAMPEPRDVWPTGVVTFTADDAYATQYTVMKRGLDRYGFPGVAHVICEQVDSGFATNLNLAQLRQMETQSGWQIGAHAHSLARHNAPGGFPLLTEAELVEEFRNMKQWALDRGFQNAEHLAYPQGYFNDTVLRVAERFFTTSRTTISRTQETWPPAEPQKLRVRNVLNTTTLEQFQQWVDDAYAGAYWLILVFHDFADTPTNGNQTTPALFNQMVDYVAAKGIAVATTADVIARRRLPAGTAAQVAPVIEGGHAVSAGVETYSRLHATQAVSLTGARLQLTRFTPHRDRTISSMSFATTAAAASGLTLARLGLYLVNPDDSLTLVAASLNDATMGTAASTLYTKPLDTGGGLPATYTLRRGQRYSIGVLVAGTTPPGVIGVAPGVTGMAGIAPATSHQLSGQSDLPTTIAAGAQVVTNNAPWFYLV